MNFENEKKQALAKLDHSKKGTIDRPIAQLLQIINDHEDFYTTSSCSGRIIVLTQADRKDRVRWLFTSHNAVTYEGIRQSLDVLPDAPVWFRMESPILHMCARNAQSAAALIKLLNDNGFRRSCLLSISKRKVIEVMFSDAMDVPIAQDNVLLVNKCYLQVLVEKANEKLKKSHEKIKNLERLFSAYQ